MATVLTAAPAVRAQTRGWALDRFEPSPAGDTTFSVDRPWYNGPDPIAVRFGVVVDYAHDPLVARQGGAGSAVSTAAVEHMLVAHGQVGIAFLDRIGVHLSVPVSLWQEGTAVAGVGPASGPNVGDPRLGVRIRVFNHTERDAFSLHIGGDFFFNAGLFGVATTFNTTDNNFRGRAYVNASGRVGAFNYSVNVGGHIRPSVAADPSNPDGTEISSDLFAQAAVGFMVLDDKLDFGLEGYAATVLDHAFQWRYLNGEALAGVHYRIADTVLVGLGAGPGLSQGAGTPDVRALAQLAYAPVHHAQPAGPRDSDRDGVLDPEDLCPSVPQGAHPDPARAGCPEGDRDHDSVLDHEDQCPDEAQGEHPDPSRRGCPDGDRDHDTVLDHADQCPDEAQGEHPDPARAGCPDGDDDHDGVFNTQDQCRDVPAGSNPDASRPGCPTPDRDHDTVGDNVDHCPDQPGAPNPDPQRNGCPGLVVVENGTLRLMQPVFFATNRDVILERSFHVLTAVADAFRASPQIHRISIEGHTDDVGPDARNLDLSQRRAASVMHWLVEHGIEAQRLEAHGYGETRPVHPVDGLRGRALRDARAANRRVEFHITDPADTAGASSGAAAGATAAPNGGTP